MDGGFRLGRDLVPHGVRPDKPPDAFPSGAGDAHRQEGKLPEPGADGFQSPAHRALRVAGGAEILEIHQPAGAVCKDQVGTGGAHVDAQGAALRRDSAGGRGIRYKDLGAVLQGRTAAQAVPRV